MRVAVCWMSRMGWGQYKGWNLEECRWFSIHTHSPTLYSLGRALPRVGLEALVLASFLLTAARPGLPTFKAAAAVGVVPVAGWGVAAQSRMACATAASIPLGVWSDNFTALLINLTAFSAGEDCG